MEYYQPKTNKELLLDFIARTKWVLVLIAVAIVGILVFGFFQIEVTANMRVVLVMSMAALAAFYFPSSWVLNRLYTPTFEFILAVDAASDMPVEIYQVGSKVVNDLELENGKQIYTYRGEHGTICHICREYDPEENVAVVNLRKPLDDVAMIDRMDRIEANRLENRKEVMTAIKLKNRISEVVEGIISDVHNNEMRTLQELQGLEDEAEIIEQNIQRQVEEFGSDEDEEANVQDIDELLEKIDKSIEVEDGFGE